MKTTLSVLTLLLVLGCRTRPDTAVGPESLTIGIVQAFHGRLGDFLGSPPVLSQELGTIVCCIVGFQDLHQLGQVRVDACGHMRLPSVCWEFREAEQYSNESGPLILTVSILPRRPNRTSSYFLNWRGCDVEIRRPSYYPQDQDRLRKKADLLVEFLRKSLTEDRSSKLAINPLELTSPRAGARGLLAQLEPKRLTG